MTRFHVKTTWTIAALAALLTFGTTAGAQTVTASRCAAAKTRCVIGKTHVCGVAGERGQLKCHQRAHSKSSPVDPECLQLAVSELRDCFRDAERLGDCLTTNDHAAHQAEIDAFVDGVVHELHPRYPAPVTNECLVGKLKTVAEAAADKLYCFDSVLRNGGAVDQNCLLNAEGRLVYLWGRLEANGNCLTTGDGAVLQERIDAFVAATVVALDPVAP